MAYKQITTPFLDDEQITLDGAAANNWCGWCLKLTDKCFDVAPFAATALKAWEANKTQHCDRDLPEGVYVPVFWRGDDQNWGHVAIALKTGNNIKIWSSPYRKKCYFDIFEGEDAIDQMIRVGYGTKFLGWTETLGDKTICEYYEPEPEPEPETPAEEPADEPEFKEGDKVKPTRLVDYDGVALIQYDTEYTITQINGDRVVLSAPRGNGMQIWAALNIKDIERA